jgi:putative transposase
MGEIAEDMHEGPLALAVGAGLQVMAALMEVDVAAMCGPRGPLTLAKHACKM